MGISLRVSPCDDHWLCIIRYHSGIELEEGDEIALNGGFVLYFLSLYLRWEGTSDISTAITHFSDWHDHLQAASLSYYSFVINPLTRNLIAKPSLPRVPEALSLAT